MTPWTITPRLLYGILQARILEWVAIPFSRESSQRRTQTLVFCTAADSLPSEPPGKPHSKTNMSYSYHIPYHILPYPLENHPLFVEIPPMRDSLPAWDPILLLHSSAMSYFFQSSYCSVYWIFLKTWYKGFQARANYEGFFVGFFFWYHLSTFFWGVPFKNFSFQIGKHSQVVKVVQSSCVFFTFPNGCCCCCCWVTSVVSDSVRPHRPQPTRLPCPWDSPVKNTGVGCHFLLQCMKVKSESEVAPSCPTQRPHGLQPTRLLHPWDFPGKSTGVGCHCLLRSPMVTSYKTIVV